MPLIFRIIKGEPLTFLEGDNNLRYLEELTVSSSANFSNWTGSASSQFAGTASLALTASYALNAGTTVDTGSLISTESFNAFTASYNTGSFTGTFTGDLIGTASYVNLSAGPGIIINGLEITSSVRTVNGIFPTDGNIPISLSSTVTGTSASLASSGSGDITGSIPDGLVWIISNDPTPANNGDVYIYNSGSVGAWYQVAPLDQAASDARYIKLDGANTPMTGDLNMGGNNINNAGNINGTASYATSASQAISASWAPPTIIDTGSLLLTSSFNNFTSSYYQDSSSFDQRISSITFDTGSLLTTESFNSFTASYNTGSFTGSFTGDLIGTASWANNATTASYALETTSASFASTASYVELAQTASYALNAITASHLIGYPQDSASFNQRINSISFDTSSLPTPAITVNAATTAALPRTPLYNNGLDGVGAFISASTNGTLGAIDGITLIDGDRILVKNQAIQLQNGVYEIITTGSASTRYIMSRSLDSDETSELDSQIVIPSFGTTNAGGIFAQNTNNPVVGTNNIVYIRQTSTLVSQNTAGTQAIYQIPWWTGATRDLSRGSTHFRYINVTSGTTVTTSSLQLTGSFNLSGSAFVRGLTTASQTNVLTYNSSTGQVFFTASSAIGGTTIDTSSLVTTTIFNAFTSSYNTGSFSGSFTGLLIGTASWADNAITASYALNAASASFASTSSLATNAITASFALATATAPASDRIIAGNITASVNTTDNIFTVASSSINLMAVSSSGVITVSTSGSISVMRLSMAGANPTIENNLNNTIVFRTNNQDRFKVASNNVTNVPLQFATVSPGSPPTISGGGGLNLALIVGISGSVRGNVLVQSGGLIAQGGEFRITTGSTDYLRVFPLTGNVFIGSTPVDGGFKLDVNGTTRLQGALNVSTGGATIVGNTTVTGSLDVSGSGRFTNNINVGNLIIYSDTSSQVSTLIGTNNINTGGGGYNVLIGRSVTQTSILGESVGIGFSVTTAFRGIAIGRSVYASSGIAFGSATVAESNEFVAGSTGVAHAMPITNIYFGSGKERANGETPTYTDGDGVSYTINGSGARGTNFTGGNITVAGGKGTGTGSAGDIIFSTATTGSTGTTLQSLTNRVWIKGHTGFVGIGTSSPSASLDVSGSGRFTNGLTVTGSLVVSGAISTTDRITVPFDPAFGTRNFLFNTAGTPLLSTISNDTLGISTKAVFASDVTLNSERLSIRNLAGQGNALSIIANSTPFLNTPSNALNVIAITGSINLQSLSYANIINITPQHTLDSTSGSSAGITGIYYDPKSDFKNAYNRSIVTVRGDAMFSTSGTGSVYIGTSTTSSFKLDVSGSGRFTGTATIGSSTITGNFGNMTLSNNGVAGNLITFGPNNAPHFTGRMKIGPVGLNAVDSAMLEISSTTQGFLQPRMTATQRNAISFPDRGLQVYDISSDTEGMWYYNSGSYQAWTRVLNSSGSQSIGGSLTVTGSLDISGSGRFTDGLTVNGSIIVTGSVPNRSTMISSSGLFISRVSDGGYASSITADGSLFFDTRNNHVFRSDGTALFTAYTTGEIFIGKGTQDPALGSSGFRVQISGSGASGSFKVNNNLLISGSNTIITGSLDVSGSGRFTDGLTVTGSFTVITGSNIELQVTNTGVRMGNTGSDAHIASGSFTVSTPPPGPIYLSGGMRVEGSNIQSNYATTFTIGNYQTVALNSWHLGPWNNSPRVVLHNTNTASLCIPTENIIFGGSPTPTAFNESRMLIGVNDKNEYSGTTSWPSGSNNYFYINTLLHSPNPGTNIRRPLYIGADSIRFYTGGNNASESFNRAPKMTISESGLDVSGSGRFTDGVTVTGSVTITDVLTLSFQDPLPSGKPTGSIALSGSGATYAGMFVYDGTNWVTA